MINEVGYLFILLIILSSIAAIAFELYILKLLPTLTLIAFLLQNLFLMTGVLLFALPSLFPSDRLLAWNGEPYELVDFATIILLFNLIFYFTATACLFLLRPENRVINFTLDSDKSLINRSWLVILLAATTPLAKFVQIESGFKHYYNSGTILETNVNSLNMALSLAGSFGLLGLALLFYLVLIRKKALTLAIFIFLTGSYFYFSKAGAGLNVFINILFIMIFGWFFVNFSRKKSALRFLNASLMSILVVALGLVFKNVLRGNDQVYSDGVFLGLINTFRASAPSVENLFVIWKRGQVASLSGETLWLIPQSIIPRFIWPDKPEISLSTWFHDNIWRTPAEMFSIPAGKQGNALYLYSEGMLNFGILGVILFAIIYGIILFGLTCLLSQRNFLTSGFRFAFLCIIAYDLLIPGLTFAYLISSVVKSLIILLLIYFVLSASIKLNNEDKFRDKPV